MTFDEFLREAAPGEGLAWRKYRRRAARHRVEGRMRELGIDSFAAYLDRLHADPVERAALADRMRVTVSRFFRERAVWQTLATAVLPDLLAGKAVDEPLRAWSAGCCGGEEPYTLAILWLEAIAPRQPQRRLEIVASDIDAASLARAAAGRYEAGSLREVPAATRRRFFLPAHGQWQVAAEVRALVRLERRNLMLDPLPSDMDLVLCRYLPFTYYQGERLLEATRRLRAALRPGGVLMVGGKESVPAGGGFDRLPAGGPFYRRVD